MSTKGHVPLRMCIGCRKRRKKEEMIRFKQGKEGVLFMDEKKELPGRGLYLCPEVTCLNLAQKRIRISRVFDINGASISFDSMFFKKGLA